MPQEPFTIDALSTSPTHRERAELQVLAEEFAHLSNSPNTVRAYRSDWRAFSTWCEACGYLALPATAHTVIPYATHAAAKQHLSRATVLRRMAAVRRVHESRGLPSPVSDPTTRAVLSGIRRTKAAAPELARAPIRTVDIRRLLQHVPIDTLGGLRDRALLLLGYASGCTRAELVALDVEDIGESQLGLLLRVRRGQIDQDGYGQSVGIPHGRHPDTCPVSAVQNYLATAGLSSGPMFRAVNRGGHLRMDGTRLSAQSVALKIKHYAELADMPASRLSAFSLRAGLIQQAREHGAPIATIMAHTGHRDFRAIQNRIQKADAVRESAASYLGL